MPDASAIFQDADFQLLLSGMGDMKCVQYGFSVRISLDPGRS